MTLKQFLGQPTTVAGLATLTGTLHAALTGTLTWNAAVPLLVGAAVAILLPDNTAFEKKVETLTGAVESFVPVLPPVSPK